MLLSKFDYSDYRVGQALRAQNKISFGSLSQLKEVTHFYNKKVEGKDHSELKNLHIYEYPDTNLRVIVDENRKL